MEVVLKPSDTAPKPLVGTVPCESFASGKAILIGEHAVVYGATAIAMPLSSMPAQFRLTRIKEGSLNQSQLFMQGELMSPEICGIVDEALELIGREQYHATIEGFSHLPIGAGLGASASLAIGILRVLSDFFAIKLEKRNLAVLGNQLEKRFHGTPSGLDTAVVSYEQTIQFSRPNIIEAVKISPLAIEGKQKRWPFVLIDSGVRSPTKEMIDIARPYFSGPFGLRRIEKFNDLAERVKRSLVSGDIGVMQECIQEAASGLEQAGVYTEKLLEIQKTALEIGAMACKPTGAGGGGCMLALLDPRRDRKQVQELKNKFGSHFIYEVYCG